MRQLLSRILFGRVRQRNPGYSLLLVTLGCLMAWNGITNLANVYGRVPSTDNFVLGLALLAVALQLLIDAIIYALPDSQHLTKSRLRTVVVLLAAVGLTLLIVSLVVRFSVS